MMARHMKALLCACLLLCTGITVGCSDSITVYIANNTMDNIRLNGTDKGRPHIAPGQEYLWFIFDRDYHLGAERTFNICRSYGCLAEVKVVAHFWPQQEDAYRMEIATLSITESPRNTFLVSSDSSYISASISEFVDTTDDDLLGAEPLPQ